MDKIEVSQRARDAVADYSIKWTGLDEQAANRIKDGLHDPYSLVQAFARFERDILVTRTDATPVATDVAALVEAAKAILHAVCHETGFAAAVRADSGLAYPWEPLDIAEAQLRQALAPFTKGQP